MCTHLRKYTMPIDVCVVDKTLETHLKNLIKAFEKPSNLGNVIRIY